MPKSHQEAPNLCITGTNFALVLATTSSFTCSHVFQGQILSLETSGWCLDTAFAFV
jgi:hypothetical protein